MYEMNKILIDTHIFLWLMNGSNKMPSQALQKIESCIKNEGRIIVSAISIWEIGMLVNKGRITLKEPTLQWINTALNAPYVDLASLSPEIAVESCQLPIEFHGDPADRIIVATSRVLTIPLLTKDAYIHQYAKNGHIQCLEI